MARLKPCHKMELLTFDFFVSEASRRAMNSYENHKGLHVQRLENGVIHGVQVTDPNGFEVSMSPQDYVALGIKPDIHSLPDIKTSSRT